MSKTSGERKTIYLLPGVGCDEKVFNKLELSGYEMVPLRWLSPREGEKLKDYVKRLLPQITAPEPILMGLSFGGIVSIELSKLIKTHKIIIISSIKTYHERPVKMSLLYLLKFYRILPARLAVRFRFWQRWAIGSLNYDEKNLVEEMIENIDLKFNKWAVDQAIHWDNTDIPDNIIHIHGDEDNIFPNMYIRNYHRIKGGTHFMIVRHAKQISHIILKELEQAADAPRDENFITQTAKEKKRAKAKVKSKAKTKTKEKARAISRNLVLKMKSPFKKKKLRA